MLCPPSPQAGPFKEIFLRTFFDAFWQTGAMPPAPDPWPTPAPHAVQDLPLATPNDDGLTDPVRLVRVVEKRMRREGLLDDDGPARRGSRFQRPANDRRLALYRCA